ncbi:TPA: oligo-1,6-glucosidase, partial [Enterococcus faecium]|nr:oligo-1,6-glucosidase [Enterococcus faecium]
LEYGLAPEQALKAVNKRSRDNSRTPMQWNTQKNARFSTSDNVWLKVNPNYPELNAEAQLTNQQSVFNYYHQLIKLRKNSVYKDVLIYGQFLPVKDKNEHILLYERQLEDKIVLVILNVTATEQEYYVDEQYQQVLINNYEDVLLDQSRKLRLRPFESIVLANYGGQL